MEALVRVKKLIVVGLESACTLADAVPVPYYFNDEGDRSYGLSRGMLGCYYLRLAAKSAELDKKWSTGVWTKPEEENDG